ncbi:MAG: methionine--tRNA ligase [Candidatus Aenigmatarchaeota archaeon]|nr:MAG: methionine--tRNA ligase [Candidatus Aenigmarchaeota archaeon]
MKTFFITTPIYYVNDTPHIGHAYTTIAADVIARWERLKGKNVFFLTGTDENSSKTIKGAEKYGFKDVKKYTDKMAEKWKKVWNELNISFTDFIRTTQERHKKTVEVFFRKVWENGDIYKGKYAGLYCEGCEAFLTENELVNGLCPHHKTRPKVLTEENYFFRLSKYQEKLLVFMERNPEFVKPETRRNEVINLIKQGLKDISISRPGLEWGIRVPVDKEHVFWVWFDALINYISADPENWPADLHLMAKDILRFHAIVWPAMLMSAGYELPKRLFAHGFFTVNGEKISKSLGNAIDPVEIAKKYSVDALRYFLMREIPFGEDGDFSEEALKKRVNGELVSDLGNLVSRVLTLSERYKGQVKGRDEISEKLNFEKINSYMERLELHHALMEIFSFIRAMNKYINEKEPWKMKGEELGNVLYNLLEGLRVVSVLLYPFMPETAEKITEQLGIEKRFDFSELSFKEFKGKPKKGEHLFEKV